MPLRRGEGSNLVEMTRKTRGVGRSLIRRHGQWRAQHQPIWRTGVVDVTAERDGTARGELKDVAAPGACET